MVPLLAIVVVALFMPAAAAAKVSCEEPRRAAGDVPLHGLPAAPVAGRTYRLTATVDEGVNPAPHLGAEHCGDDVARESTAGVGGWFRRSGRGNYELEVRFTHAGPWAVSLMDRDGRFHELGMRHVGNALRRALPPLFQPLWWPQFSTK